MSHQSNWGYYKQPIKLPLVKVNHVGGDFILILERPSLFFYKQKQVFLYWSYYDIPVLRLLWLSPRILWMGVKRVWNLIINQRILTCHQGFVPGALLLKINFEVGNLVHSSIGTIQHWDAEGRLPVMVFARLPSTSFALCAVRKKRIKSQPCISLFLCNMFQFV